MIAFDGVAARRAPLALASLSLTWAAGSHAIVGSPTDGGPLVLALIAGLARPRAGQIRVLDGVPTATAVRKQVALIPFDPRLPDTMNVNDALGLAASIRGEPRSSGASRLEALGVESLAERPVRSLSRAEARAVALVEAVTSARVRVLLIEEPLVAIDPRAVGRVPEVLRERARAGLAVVASTASVRDANELADDFLFLRAGAVQKATKPADAVMGFAAGGARLHILTHAVQDAQALVAALAHDAQIESIERDGAALHLGGNDVVALSRAAGRAAVEARVNVVELRFDPAPTTASPRAANDRATRGTV